MTTVLTTAGGAEWTALEAGTASSYETLVLGRGNDTPGSSDTVADITSQLKVVSGDAPVKNDPDARNPGRGAAVWTFTFRIPAMAVPIVASNLGLAPGSPESADDLAVSSQTTVWTDPYRVLLVYVNVGASAATVYTAYDVDPRSQAALRSYGARADVIIPGRGGQVMRIGQSHERIYAGEPVPFRARLYDDDGALVTPSQIASVEQTLETWLADRGSWDQIRRRQVQEAVCAPRGDARYGTRGSYNVDTRLDGRFTRDGDDKRVQYKVTFNDGTVRIFEQVVRVI